MKKALILTVFFAVIATFLQLILFGTSPKIECSELNHQFYVLLQNALNQFVVLFLIEILLLQFWFKTDLKKILVAASLFTFLFLSIFSCFFYMYYQAVCK